MSSVTTKTGTGGFAGTSFTMTPSPRGLVVDGSLIALEAAQRGDGVMLGRRPFIDSHLRSGTLVEAFAEPFHLHAKLLAAPAATDQRQVRLQSCIELARGNWLRQNRTRESHHIGLHRNLFVDPRYGRTEQKRSLRDRSAAIQIAAPYFRLQFEILFVKSSISMCHRLSPSTSRPGQTVSTTWPPASEKKDLSPRFRRRRTNQ